MKSFFTFLLSCFISVSLLAQISKHQPQSGVVQSLEDSRGFPIYLKFDTPVFQLQEAEFLPWIAKNLRLPAKHDFAVLRTETDQIGFVHTRYQQQVQGVPVLGGIYIAHSKGGILTSFNGHFYPVSETVSTLSEEEAKLAALEYFAAQAYRWKVGNEVQVGAVPLLSAIPARLIYAPTALDFARAEFKLCYEIELYSTTPFKKEKIYLDATSGVVIASENQICTYNHDHTNHEPHGHSECENFVVEGTAETMYSGTRTIETTSIDLFELRDMTRGNGIVTLDAQNGDGSFGNVSFLDDDNFWSALEWDNADQDQAALDGHWGIQSTYDYYLNLYNRNAIDDNGNLMNVYIHVNTNYGNAYWDGTGMYFGDGTGIGSGTLELPTTTLEICAHEYTHGVTDYTADLIYDGESGGLNESFSDIFGHATDRYTRPDVANWLMGEESAVTNGGIRSFSDPNVFSNPDTYLGTFWGGGVHNLSGVQNHWYYLLSEGGTGTNDLGDSFAVNGIGYENAAAIAYRNLSFYLTPSSTYPEAAFFAILAAEDLFSACSDEVAATAEAWYAVGIQTAGNFTSANFSADVRFGCELPFTVNFTELSLSVDSLFWDFGDGNTSQQNNPTHTYTEEGNYTVSLVIYNCDDQSDTLVQPNYIVVDTLSNVCDTIIMPTGNMETITACSGVILDPGGEMNYSNGENSTVIIAPPNAGQITLEFSDFSLESSYDYLTIYDGNSLGAPIVGSFTGSQLPPIIQSSGGALTMRFTSDGSVTFPGFSCLFTADGSTTADATFSVDDEVAVGSVFSPIAIATAGNFFWDFGDGTTSVDFNPTHFYEQAGVYEINLTLSNCQGSETFSQTVTVLDNRSITGYTPDSICVTLFENETITESILIFSEGSDSSYLDYHIPFSNLAEEVFSQEEMFMFSGATTSFDFPISDINNIETLTITLTSNGDFDDETELATIDINNGAFEQVIDDGNVSNGIDIVTTFTFTNAELAALFNNGVLPIQIINSDLVDVGFSGVSDLHRVDITASYNQEWLMIDPLIGWSNTDTTSFGVTLTSDGLVSGTYEYSIQIINNDLSFGTIEIPVKMTVIAPPLAQFTLDVSSCDGFLVTNNQSVGGGTSYEWDFGDGNGSIEESPVYQYLTSGDFTVSLVVCNDIGCDTASQMVTIDLAVQCETNLPDDGSSIEINACDGTLYDAGGPGNNYDNSINGIATIFSPTSELIQLTFTEFDTESCCDFVRLYDGEDTNAPLIGSYSGTSLLNETILSSGSALTIRMSSDGSVTREGFAAVWECTSPLPVADFEYNICQETFSGTDLSTVFPNSWSWDFGDGNTSTEQNATNDYTASGDYLVTLITCNNFGCDTTSQTITIDLTAPCEINLPSNGETITIAACEGTFYDAGGPDSNYPDSADGTIVITNPNGEVLLLTFPEFELQTCCDFVTIYDGNNIFAPLIGSYNSDDLLGVNIISSSPSLTIRMTSSFSGNFAGFVANWQCISPEPIADFSYLNCEDNVFFNDESLLNPTSWSWDFGNGITSSEQNPTYVYPVDGSYPVTLIACNSFGCDTTTQTVVVDFDVECEINMPSDGSTIYLSACSGTFYDAGGPDNNYSNNIDGTIILTNPDEEIMVLTFPEFELESCCDYVYIYDGEGTNAPLIGIYNWTDLAGVSIVSSSSFLTVQMTTDGSVTYSGFVANWACFNGEPLASFTYETENNFCNNSFEFTNQSVAADSLVWVINGGNPIVNVESFFHSFNENGTHTVTLQAFNDEGMSEHSEEIVMSNISFTGEAEIPETAMVEEQVIFTSEASNPNGSWTWMVNGSIIAFTEDAIFTFENPGIYMVSVIMTDPNTGCEFHISETIEILLDVATNHLETDEHIRVFPNPVSDQLSVNYQVKEDMNVVFKDVLGRTVHRFSLKKGDEQLSFALNNLNIATKGIYFIQFFKQDRLVLSEKIVVQ